MQLCRRRGAAALAFFLLFLNGGLGFFYTLDATVNGYEVTTMWDNLANVMQGYYQTPTNQPDPHNLRWSTSSATCWCPSAAFWAAGRC